MKCQIPEISWHNRDPVLSVDIQPNSNKNFYRLASGGTDSHVLIWHMILNDDGSTNLELASDLTRHQRAVNVVKWSPDSKYLASGDDESVIFIWKLKEENEPINIVDFNNEQDKETWVILKILRGHMEDVYDLSWSPNSLFIVSGSVDNTAIIWDVQKGKSVGLLNDHKGFVQGVTWDPNNEYIATLSTDRFLRIFNIQKKKVVASICKCDLPNLSGNETSNKNLRIFHDDTLQTFFRRLSFSPDGNLLVTPAGILESVNEGNISHSTYIFSRFSLKQPVIVLPSPDQYSVAVKFCPLLFTLHPFNESNQPVIPLKYRMVFAVATKSSVYLYDTQQKQPFGIISNIHYTRLTDMAWSNDGKILIVSSTDGFCSLVTFTDGELGDIYKPKEIKLDEQVIPDNENIKEIVNDEKMETDDNNEDLAPIVELFIDKTIISSQEKFETPEKKILPVTPISIRRYPRTFTANLQIIQSPETPIRIQTMSKDEILNKIDDKIQKNTITEEAQDSWQLKSCDKEFKTNINKPTVELEPQNDQTEDIRLVYEESQDDTIITKENVTECKTPRRVQLTTISTPKSSKKT